MPCAFVLQSFLILELAFLEKNEFSYVRHRVKEKVKRGNGFKFQVIGAASTVIFCIKVPEARFEF